MNTKALAGTPWRRIVKRTQRRFVRMHAATSLGPARLWAERDRFDRALWKVREALRRRDER